MAETIKEDQENEESMFRTLLNKVPANMRFLAADLVGMDSKATNEKFTDEGLAILKEAAINALDKGKSSMTYEDYPGGEMNHYTYVDNQKKVPKSVYMLTLDMGYEI